MMFPQMAESHNKKTTPLPVLDDAGYALVIRLPLDYSLYSSITPEKFRSIAIVLDPVRVPGEHFQASHWNQSGTLRENVARKQGDAMERWRDKWALVTGASAGIGRALVEQLAAAGAHLVLTARRRDRLEQLAADLMLPRAPDELFAFTQGKGIEIELLVNNAGFGNYGPFYKSELSRELAMTQVNCTAVVHLTRLFLPAMVERKHGDVLILGSTASFQGVPFIATYAATKAFDLLFAEALAEEVREFGVRVCCLCPGATQSEFREVAGTPARATAHQETAEKVARVGLRALAAGKSYVISGMGNYLMAQSERLTPRRMVTRIAGSMFRPR